MPRRIVRAGQVLLLTTLLVPATASVHAASPSPAASASPAPTSPAALGMPHDAPRLEALLPVEIDGSPLFRTSFGPATWAGLDPASLGALGALVDEFGVTIDAISFAAANDPTADPLYNLFALAVAGVPGPDLAEAYARLAQQGEICSTLEPAIIGGIDVTHLDAPYNPIPHVWTWSVGDVVLGIQASDEATATRLIALLPTSVPAPETATSASSAPEPVTSASSAPEPVTSASSAPEPAASACSAREPAASASTAP